MFSDHIRGLETLENRIRVEIDNMLGVSADIKLVEPKSIPRSEGKAVRVIDKRSL
jgi:phenylacetate-CoA ligase